MGALISEAMFLVNNLICGIFVLWKILLELYVFIALNLVMLHLGNYFRSNVPWYSTCVAVILYFGGYSLVLNLSCGNFVLVVLLLSTQPENYESDKLGGGPL